MPFTASHNPNAIHCRTPSKCHSLPHTIQMPFTAAHHPNAIHCRTPSKYHSLPHTIQMPFTASHHPNAIHCLTPSLSFALSIHEVSLMCAVPFISSNLNFMYVIICKGCVVCPFLHLITLTVFGERCDLIDSRYWSY